MRRKSLFTQDFEMHLSRHKLASILLFFVALFMTGEILLRAIGAQLVAPYGKTMKDYNLIYSHAVDQHDRGKRLCVLVGDSRVEWGASPELLQGYLERHGVRDVEVFNLAFPGANVRNILAAFLNAQFYPEYLVIGYSHLSFYWSLTEFGPIEHVGRQTFGEIINQKVHVWLSENSILLGPWRIDEQLRRIRDRHQYSWIAERRISEGGQAFIRYAISEEVAIDAQKKFYENMYRVPMPETRVSEINKEFQMQTSKFKEHGTRVLIMRMPVADWALQAEQNNDVYPLERLGGEVGLPILDLNQIQGMSELRYYDGLHVAPSSSPYVSEQIGKELRQFMN